MSHDCLFCKIVREEIPATVVHRDDHVVAFRDVNPQAPTHILIVPRAHIASMNEAGEDNASLLGRLLLTAKDLAVKEGIDAGYRLVNNCGSPAGQSVFHIHVHLLGGRPMAWPPG